MAETPTSDNPYFMTGAGGLLQAVIKDQRKNLRSKFLN